MGNWKLKDLRDERRRNFLKMVGVAAAAVGIDRLRILNFLADEGGYGLAEAANQSYGRALIVPCANGSFAWMQELWPFPDVAIKAINDASSGLAGPEFPSGTSNYGSVSSYLYTPGYGYNASQSPQFINTAGGTYVQGNGYKSPRPMPTFPGNAVVKTMSGGDHEFFYGPDAPWMVNGSPKYWVTGLMAGKDETHTAFPGSATVFTGTGAGSLQAALAALGSAGSNAAVPVLGIDPVRYGVAPGAPEVATVPNAQGMIDLFNSAASRFVLASPVDQEIFDTYYKALIGLRKSSGRSTWAPQMQITKNAARIIGLNFGPQLTPTLDQLASFGLADLPAANLNESSSGAPSQRPQLEAFGRALIIVSNAFKLGLSKTAILSLSPGATSETQFTDPHASFNTGSIMQQARNTTHFIGRMLDAFYNDLATAKDPESPADNLDQNTVFVSYGDTPHTPLAGKVGSWPDATPNACNWMYVMDPRQSVKNGWFGQVYTDRTRKNQNGAGVNAVGYDPVTGEDDPTKTSEQVAPFGCCAAVYAVAKADRNKTASFGGPAPNTIPALLNKLT